MASTSSMGMDVDDNPYNTPPPQPQVQAQVDGVQPTNMSLNSFGSACTYRSVTLSPTPYRRSIFASSTPPQRRTPASSRTIATENQSVFKDIPVKVHVRRPDKDNWAYLGRALVCQEAFGQGTRIVVRALSTRKVITAFTEGAPIQAEKRGNFVVALNSAETLRLLALLELSCMLCGKSNLSDSQQAIHRRRIARLIREDKKRRHKRRKDQDAMVAAFARTGLGGGEQQRQRLRYPIRRGGAS
ncbi:hypothetical protein NM688_g4349 [Phlebia brevispora]|uniref:Uncharacterized protein n=1 Tax=Phlebia brevispora TaxID=194682 RepID=A0ACC1T363_9APHY|nr:hypothetical protein NM688_g4349 [Phlebia brevispora]